MPVIEVEHLSKTFQLGQLESLKTSLVNQTKRLIGQPVEQRELFRAVDDVTFEIQAGEVVGVIGHNGAGKSTLLKLISRITSPTSGKVSVKGRIAPLIEVGAGFVPNLTGRENVYLNGSILGLSRKEINRKFDEIVDFSEMQQFIDTPVKRYSSGMKVKLAFAVATSIESEILIVDEVLAVGDLAFQRKCFNRMQELINESGRTVLLVSHNIRQVSRICSRVLLFEKGKLLLDDSPGVVADAFYRASNEKILADSSAPFRSSARIESSGEVELIDVDVIGPDEKPVERISSGAPLRVRVRFNCRVSLHNAEIVIGTHTTDFVYLDAGSTARYVQRKILNPGNHEVIYSVESYPLMPGQYSVRFAVLDQNRRMVFSGEAVKSFLVESSRNEVLEASARLLDLESHWTIDGAELC